MRMAKANIMGFILTDANSGDTGYGHYGYGYGYGYGYSEVKGKNEKKKNSGNIDDDDYDDDYEDYNWGNIVKDSVAPASEKDENLSEDE